jgi:signal transduction histidine kinase
MTALAGPIRARHGTVALAAVAAVVAVAAVAVGQLLDMGDRQLQNVGFAAAIAVPFTILGLLVLASMPAHPVGRLMTAAGLTATVHLVALSWTAWTPLAWLAQWVWWPAVGLIFLALLRFPDGSLRSSRWQPVAAFIVVTSVVGAVLLAVAAFDEPRFVTAATPPTDPWADRVVGLFRITAQLTMLGYLGALWSLVARWRRAGFDTRRQLLCLVPAAVVLVIGLVFDSYGLNGAWALAAEAVPLGMAVAILRYRLFDVDLIVNRTIVWLIMTALVLLGGAVIVEGLTAEPVAFTGQRAAVLATGIVVLTFEPLHGRVQHSVNHLLYGERGDPYLVIARLGEVLGCTVDHTHVMPLVTGTIARSLQVPYVGIQLQERDGPVMVTEHGRPVPEAEAFPMVARGETIGYLLVGRRSAGARFSHHEWRLLQDVAVQAATAARATRLTRDLQVSRERLVTSREEERRRLRRDLHDGLGPALAGLSMQARAALALQPPDSRTRELLDGLAEDLRTCTVEVRRLVDELRPPALDRGLEAAVRGECARFDSLGPAVRCEINGLLEGLPAAVEVAAFRVLAEALTNVARHSGAGTCRVVVDRGEHHLRVVVSDDGVGIPPTARRGLGLASMAERGAELGGSCTITPSPDGGTEVRLELPVDAPSRDRPPVPVS